MAFEYDIRNCCGKARIKAWKITQDGPKPFYITVKLFEGNGFLAGIYVPDVHDRSKDQLHLCFVSEDHAKICLGLKKYNGEKRNIYEADYFKKITLYRDKCREFRKILNVFAESLPEITIEIKGDAENV